jgi:hypothetical protein
MHSLTLEVSSIEKGAQRNMSRQNTEGKGSIHHAYFGNPFGDQDTETKIKFFNTNVKTVLLFGSETMKATCKRLQVFINRCLCAILKLQWSNKTTNKDLWEKRDNDWWNKN